MKLAIVDLGTNSVRFDIHEVIDRSSHRRLHREKQMVRLGDGVFKNGKVKKDNLTETIQAFLRFKERLSQWNVQHTISFATSALRDASNSSEVTQEIKNQTGFDVEVISGEQEAELIAKGIINNELTPPDWFAIIDIGGGSTEVIICRKKTIIKSFSFKLGSNRLQQSILKTVPPDTGQNLSRIVELRKHIKKTIAVLQDRTDWPQIETVVGSSGTIRAYRRIIKRSGLKIEPFKLSSLEKLINTMAPMTTEELLQIPGLDPKRVDIILSGGILLEEIMKNLGAKKVYTTEYTLRDGILERVLEKAHSTQFDTQSVKLGS